MTIDLEHELDRLYGVELAEFVAERTRIAGALRKEGRRAEAQQVQERRKPPLSVWAVNQLARSRRKDVARLLEAGDRLAVAQLALLGGGERRAFERAAKAEREALKRLSQAARSILAERSSPATLERVNATLRAAAVTEAVRAELARGRLTTDIDPAGFDAFAARPASPTAAPRPRAQRRPATDERAERARADREAASKRAAIDRARAKLQTASEHEATLASKLREAERAERAARDAHQEAERTAVRLRADHDAAATALEAVRAKLEHIRGS